jgi:hypothetical protein
MRFYQYLPWLNSAGISIAVAPLFSDVYVQVLQSGRKSLLEILRSYMGRVQSLFASRQFDLLWIEKETLPWLPAVFEKLLMPSAIPYVLDYDDAVFHQYDENRNPIIWAALKGKHPALIRGAVLVVAGNEYLAEFARRAGARHVKLMPTVIDLARYPAAVCERAGAPTPPCVGWIGQRATAAFLTPYAPLFKRLSTDKRARFAAVGIDAKSLGLPMDSIPWAEQTEVDAIASFDIGWNYAFAGPAFRAGEVRLQADSIYGVRVAGGGVARRREPTDC